MTEDNLFLKYQTFLTKLKDANWREVDRILQSGLSFFDKKDLDKLVYNENSWEELIEGNRLPYWTISKLADSIIRLYKDEADDILKNSNNDSFKALVVQKGFYSDVSILNFMAKNSSGEAKLLAVQYCSVETLRELKNDKSSKVRKVVFQRLGPVECLDDMLSDKIADIRGEGVRMAPYSYPKLNEMTKEIARLPFSGLVEKISSEYLPMLLANRNLQNKWISNKLKQRLDVEGE